MKTKHAEIRAQQRGINDVVETLLQAYGDSIPATRGCVLRFFSKASIKEIQAEFGHHFVAINHENCTREKLGRVVESPFHVLEVRSVVL